MSDNPVVIEITEDHVLSPKTWSFEHSDRRYQSVYHYVKCEKARLFGQEELELELINDPNLVDKISPIPNFKVDHWEHFSHDICMSAWQLAATHNPSLVAQIQNTGDSVLAYVSLDPVLGVGTINSDLIRNPGKWYGKNFMGHSLMVIRSYIPNLYDLPLFDSATKNYVSW